MCWLNKVFLLMVFSLSVLSMLSSCGNKGDLYLPKKAQQPQADNINHLAPNTDSQENK